MSRFYSSDGWLFATIIGAGKYSLKDIISHGDILNHAVFTLDEINNGLSRLVTFGFAEVKDKEVRHTKAAKRFYFLHSGLIKGWFESGTDMLLKYCRIFEKKSLPAKVNYIEYFSPEEYATACGMYGEEMREWIEQAFHNKQKYIGTWINLNKDRVGTCYYEFQQGKFSGDHWQETSIFFSGEDDGGMHIFSLFINDFEMTGVTIINEIAGGALIAKIKQFKGLLLEGISSIDALKEMRLYKKINANSWEEQIAASDKNVIIKTANALIDWLNDKLKTYKAVSILGL